MGVLEMLRVDKDGIDSSLLFVRTQHNACVMLRSQELTLQAWRLRLSSG